MKTEHRLLHLLCILAVFCAVAVSHIGHVSAATVVTCFDGDTVKLMDRRVLRIVGMNAPELGKEKKNEQFYAKEAKQELWKITAGRKVTVVPHPDEPKDPYGRLFSDLLLDTGESVSELMIQKGAAYFYPHATLTEETKERLINLQKEAITARVGLWARLLTSPIAEQNYIGDRTTLMVFPADCPEAQAIKPRNRMYFGTIMDAFLIGFAPANTCPFWPDAASLH